MRHTASRIGTIAGLVLIATAGTGSTRSPAPLAGYTYRMHMTMTNSNPMLPPNMAHSEISEVVTWAGGRTRMDVTEGSMAGVGSVGDYTLSDGIDYLEVQPAEKTFSAFPTLADSSLKSVIRTMSNQKVTSTRLDSLGTEMIDGHPTRHYRTTVGMTMTIDISAAMPAGIDISSLPPEAAAALAPMTQTMTLSTDVWLGDERSTEVPMSVGSMQQFSRSMSMGGMADSMASLRARIPKGRPVRTITRVINSSTGPIARVDSTVTTLDDSPVTQVDVDPDRLTLPADFVQKPMAGMEALGLPMHAVDVDKWRKRPGV